MIVRFTAISIAYRCVLDFQDDLLLKHGFLGVPLLMLLFANCISPYIGMSSISDYKVRGGKEMDRERVKEIGNERGEIEAGGGGENE